MADEILKQLIYLSSDEKKELKEFYTDNIDTNDYITQYYNEQMIYWFYEYKLFQIPNGLATISVDGKNKYYTLGKPLYDKDTIVDIASITKLYTEFILFDVLDEKGLTLSTRIGDIVDIYKELKDMSLFDLIKFSNTYYTDIDIRECTNKSDALKALRTVHRNKEKEGIYLYTDLPIMILTDILEVYTSTSYEELFNRYIIKKYKLKNTYLKVDSKKYLTVNKGYVNDPKANIMGGYYGHAGVKTTSEDFMIFFNNILNSKYESIFYLNTKGLDADNKPKEGVSIIGNLHFSTKEDKGIASKYMTKQGIAVQGSTRCHAETCKFKVNGKEHIVSIFLFIDLYTQTYNIKKYEKLNKVKMHKRYNVIDENGNIKKLKTNDIRSIMSYKTAPSYFKEVVNIISRAKFNDMFLELTNKKPKKEFKIRSIR